MRETTVVKVLVKRMNANTLMSVSEITMSVSMRFIEVNNILLVVLYMIDFLNVLATGGVDEGNYCSESLACER